MVEEDYQLALNLFEQALSLESDVPLTSDERAYCERQIVICKRKL